MAFTISKALDMTKDFKIPKGVLMMLKSMGLDPQKIETELLAMGKETISLVSHCDARLTALANQHQLLHELIVLEVARLHSRFYNLEKSIKELHGNREQQPIAGNTSDRLSAS
jgi:hypothetical protein